MSLDKLIEWVTHEAYNKKMLCATLFFTNKMYTNTTQIMEKLIKRFYIPVPLNMSKSEEEHFRKRHIKIIQTKVLYTLLYWVEVHFYSFNEDKGLIQSMMNFTQKLRTKDQEEWVVKMVDGIQDSLKKKFNELNQENMRITELMKKIDSTNVENSIYKLPKKGEFFEYGPEEFSQQLLYLDFENFKQVRPTELLNKNWEAKNADVLAPNILKITMHSQKVILN